MLPAVRCGLGSCARGQGAGKYPHSARAQVKHRRARRQVQLPAGVRAQPSPQPHAQLYRYLLVTAIFHTFL